MSDCGDASMSGRNGVDDNGHDQADHQSSSTIIPSNVPSHAIPNVAAGRKALIPVTATTPNKRPKKGPPLQPSSLANSFRGPAHYHSRGVLVSNPHIPPLPPSISSISSSSSVTNRHQNHNHNNSNHNQNPNPNNKREVEQMEVEEEKVVDTDGGRDATVISLFGLAVGTCVGDFSASYYRVSGRLYAATNAVMFYSNLFGFERRLCLQWDDIDDVEAYRSTSVRVFMVDCEEYVFKKLLPDRDAVLDVLKSLLRRYRENNNGGNRRPMLGAAVATVSAEQQQLSQSNNPEESENNTSNGMSQQKPTTTTTTETATVEREGGFTENDIAPINGDSGRMDSERDSLSLGRQDDDDGHDSFALRDTNYHRPHLSSDRTPDASQRRQQRHSLTSRGNNHVNDEPFQMLPPLSYDTPDQLPTRRRSHTEPTFRTKPKDSPSFLRGEESSTNGTTTRRPFLPAVPMTTNVARAVSESVLTPHFVTKESIEAMVNGGGGLTQEDASLELSREDGISTRLFAKDIPEKSVKAATSVAKTSAVPPSPQSVPPPPAASAPSPSPPTPLQTTQKLSSNVHPEVLSRAWRDAKKPHGHIAIEPTVLHHCSLDTFYALFFADDAPYALAKYQREQIGDKDVEFGAWTAAQTPSNDDASVSLERRISYLHPLNNSMGPSEARTTRQQCLFRFGEHGIILDNITVVEGIPMADCFKVIDHWIIESNEEATGNGNGSAGDGPTHSLTLSVTFHIVFTKRTMFKSLIQKNVKSETKKWFQGYMAMLKKTLDGHHQNHVRNRAEAAAANKDTEAAAARITLMRDQEERDITQLESIDSTRAMSSDLSAGRLRSHLQKVIKTAATILVRAAEYATSALSLEAFVKLAVCALLVMLVVEVVSMRQSLSNMEFQLETMQRHSAALLEVIQELSKETRRESILPKDCI